MVVAIDGPAGSGKSTVAKQVAAALGFGHLDTGGMYRIVALASLELDLPPAEAAMAVTIEGGPPLLMNGVDPGDRIRTPEVTAMQQAILGSGDWVAEGRDICQVVAPDAEVRVWLTADETERARRRAAQTGQAIAEVLAAQRDRDEADQGHGRSTLEPSEGATVVDTTGLTPADVVSRIRSLADAARA
ncbi:MAG: (d)CMP kinase [Solirubrobacterales bacterium]|nr:(d)CMP kinase [Solirubrobacterales bacterium]